MRRFLALSVVLLLATAGAALAQTGGITGVVVDGNGNPVEQARVSIMSNGHCGEYVFTGPDGVFNLADVPVGVYTLKAMKMGVGMATVEGVEVIDGQITDIGYVTLGSGGECPGHMGGGGGHGHMEHYPG